MDAAHDFSCQLSDLYQLPQNKQAEGYQLQRALYTAMTMDYSYWKTLLTTQAGLFKGISRGQLLAQLSRTQFIVQKMSGTYLPQDLKGPLAGMLLGQVYQYTGTASCFHGKLAIVQYTAQGRPDYYRIGVLSKNLTLDSDDQNGIVLDGCVQPVPTADGQRLWAYLEECRKSQNAADHTTPFDPTPTYSSIQGLQLPEGCEIYFHGLGEKPLWDQLSPFQSMLAVTKSRFVGNTFRQKANDPAQPFTVWNLHQAGAQPEEDRTHMKLYLIERQDGTWEYWSGSANCSEAALCPGLAGKENIECLVKVPITHQTALEIREALQAKGYAADAAFATPFIPDDEQHETHKALADLFASYRFSWRQPDPSVPLWEIQPTPISPSRKIDRFPFLWSVLPLNEFDGSKRRQEQCCQTAQRGCGILALWNLDETLARFTLFMPENTPSVQLMHCLHAEAASGLEKFKKKCYTDQLLACTGTPQEIALAHQILAECRELRSFLSSKQWEEVEPILEILHARYPQIAIPEKPALIQSSAPQAVTQGASPSAVAPASAPPEHTAAPPVQVLDLLKPYQSLAVAHITAQFQSGKTFYTLADEAGMGKTFVALGVIEQLYLRKRALNVYYMCSNQRILTKNSDDMVKYLEKFYLAGKPADCDRLSMAFLKSSYAITLYPMSASLMDDSYSAEGNIAEKNLMGTHEAKLTRYFKERHLDQTLQSLPIHPCGSFQEKRLRFQAYSLCVNPPDLVLLDEFHKMTTEEITRLTTLLRAFAPNCKVLFISATPFRMKLTDAARLTPDFWTLGEDDGGLRQEAPSLAKFLDLIACAQKEDILKLQTAHQDALTTLVAKQDLSSWKRAREQSAALETALKTILHRTERGRLSQQARPEELVNPYRTAWKQLLLKTPGLWERYADDYKACPYQRLVPGFGSYLLRYLNRTTEQAPASHAPSAAPLSTGISYLGPVSPTADKENRYTKHLEKGYAYLWSQGPNHTLILGNWRHNPYLSVIDQAVVRGHEQLLWVPPTKPYYRPPQGHLFDLAAKDRFSKLLVFSSWNFIPRALSSLFSHEVDRRNGRHAADLELPSLSCVLPYTRVQALAEKIPLSALEYPGTLPELVETLRCKTGLTVPEIYQALGSPQVCVYRMVKKQIEGAVSQWIDWAKTSSVLKPPTKYYRQSKKMWDAYFYTGSPNTYAQILNNNFKSRPVTLQNSIWLKFAHLMGGYTKEGLEQAARSTISLKASLSALLHYSDEGTYRWDLPEDTGAVAEAVNQILVGNLPEIIDKVGQSFSLYFHQPSILAALKTAGVHNSQALFEYCACGNLQAVLEEWFFVLKEDLPLFLRQLSIVLQQESSQVHLLTQTNGQEQLYQQECLFSQRYTDDKNDCNEHNPTWQAGVQTAFNSPFWPMVLTTTSIAQEGLDFHCYCREIMHYTLPSTPMAMEQREGRIDRYRGYIQRLRQAEQHPGLSWQDLFSQDVPGSLGIMPSWVVPRQRETEPSMERLTVCLPHTAQALRYEDMVRCKREYRGMLGIPNDLAEVAELTEICDRLGKPLSALFPDLTDSLGNSSDS